MRKSSSLPSDFISDRGPARYFHGRKQILSDFRKLLEYSTQNKWGTTFLIQGPPGAGKTALLYECEKMAREKRWKTAEINPPALWDPDVLCYFLGRKKAPKVVGGSVQIGTKGIANAELEIKWSQLTILKKLQSIRKPLLLKLDEAQTLGTVNAPPPGQAGTTANVLKAIHNGELGRPVILMAGGLGTTANTFGSLGISRFLPEGLVELGALRKEAERAVILDWLTKDGGVKEDPTAWIDAIVKETHGWPQHILSYVKPALDQLRADKSVMTAEGLNAVLEVGREARSAYYKQRTQGFPEEERQSLAKPFSDIPIGESAQLSKIMSSLTQDYSQDKAETLFRRAVEKGIIDERNGRYVIPIPSMHDWLVSKYARI